MTLMTDYRPETFEDLIGNDVIKKGIPAALEMESTRVFLITGPSGCGKTTISRIIANELGIYEPGKINQNYTELDTADFRGIDVVREIRSSIHLSPIGGADYRMWLLDECHQLTKDAQEALLKALEETPSHVYFVLATTDPHKLKDTLKRRCSHYEVTPVLYDDLCEFLADIVEDEEGDVPEEMIEMVAEGAMGSPGRALAVLDTIINLPEDLMEEQIRSKEREMNQSIELCRALIKRVKWKQAAEILKGLNQENPERIRRGVLAYATTVLLKEDKPQAYIILDSFKTPFYDSPYEQLIMATYESLFSD